MKKITNKIYIGNRKDALKYPMDSYLCVAEDFDIKPVKKMWNNKPVKKVGLIDGFGNNKTVLFRAIEVLHKLTTYGNVLVFCQKGLSRSPLVVLAYLCLKQDQEIDNAYYCLRTRKKDIQINPYLALMFFELIDISYYDD